MGTKIKTFSKSIFRCLQSPYSVIVNIFKALTFFVARTRNALRLVDPSTASRSHREYFMQIDSNEQFLTPIGNPGSVDIEKNSMTSAPY